MAKATLTVTAGETATLSRRPGSVLKTSPADHRNKPGTVRGGQGKSRRDSFSANQIHMNENTSIIPSGPPPSIGFDNADTFALLQRAARLLSNSTLVPAQYRCVKEIKEYGKVVSTEDNPNAVANCVIALNIARRMHADELMVMQNLYVVEGRPSWSSQWVIAAVNTCGKFSPIRFEMTDLGANEVEYTVVEWENRQKKTSKAKVTIQNLQCVAWVTERGTGERLEGPPVTMEMAVAEGWYGKAGSKWQTMPQMMLRYRAASFFGKLYAPELLMGLPTSEEVYDMPEERIVTGREVPSANVPRLFSGAVEKTMETDGTSEHSPDKPSVTPRNQSRQTKAGDGTPAADESATHSAGDAPPADLVAEFWRMCDEAGYDAGRVMSFLRRQAMTEGEYPADLTAEEAAGALSVWEKFTAGYSKEATK